LTEFAVKSRSLLVTHVFELLLVFGDLAGSGALASIELRLKTRDESVEGILELLLGFSVSSISSIQLGDKVVVISVAGTVGSGKEISLHLSEVSSLNRAEVSTARKS